MEEFTVTIRVDRQALNNYLWNTPNVTAKDALQEVLESLVAYGTTTGCNCGCGCWEPDPLPINFEIWTE